MALANREAEPSIGHDEMKTFMVSRRMVLAFALVCMTGSAAGSAANDDDGEPRYRLAAFDAKGIELNHYAIGNVGRMVYITDLATRKQLWKSNVWITRMCVFELHLAPDQRHAVLSITGNPLAGTSFEWISIPEGKAPVTSVDIELEEEERLRAMVADVCGVPQSKIRQLYAHFLDWTSNETCRLKWDCLVWDDAGEEKSMVGIATYSLGPKSEQRLKITSFLKDLMWEQADAVHYGDKVTLGP